MRGRRLAQFNKVVTNRVLGPLGGRVPPYAIVHHRGRASGCPYETPVVAVPFGDGFVIPLPYGADADWCRNVVAAGEFNLDYRGSARRLEPEVHEADSSIAQLPLVIRTGIRLFRVPGYLVARPPAA